MSYTLWQGDCLELLPTLEAGSIDAIVCDPPYGLSFMGKDWDHGVPGVAFWEAALRVAKPGAMLLAFGGTRTHHRLMVAIEDAGWEIRDCLMWLYGSGFPKSMDIGKALDKAAGAEREVVATIRKTPSAASENMNEGWRRPWAEDHPKTMDITVPSTDAAKQWDGWGTALKPAWEPIIMAMKPIDGTFANNALVHGVGGINVDASRITIADGATMARNNKHGANGWKNSSGGPNSAALHGEPQGRWPANLLLDEGAAAMLDEQSGERKSGGRIGTTYNGQGAFSTSPRPSQAGKVCADFEPSTGGASRFFYVAKASRADRDEDNTHPTVKPTRLMRYLVRLVTPPHGVLLDPFMGSGSTGKAVMLEGFRFMGIELDPNYFAIAQRRIAEAQAQLPLLEVSA